MKSVFRRSRRSLDYRLGKGRQQFFQRDRVGHGHHFGARGHDLGQGHLVQAQEVVAPPLQPLYQLVGC